METERKLGGWEIPRQTDSLSEALAAALDRTHLGAVHLVCKPVQVDTMPPSKMELIREISFLRKHKAARPDVAMPFQGWWKSFILEVNKTPGFSPVRERSSLYLARVRDFAYLQKGDRSSCEGKHCISNSRGRYPFLLPGTRESSVLEDQTSFQPGRTDLRPTISVFRNLKAPFNSISRAVLWRWFLLKCTTGIPITHSTSAFKRPIPSSCLRRCFTWVHHEKWCFSELLSFSTLHLRLLYPSVLHDGLL